jgi:hypothetical protein
MKLGEIYRVLKFKHHASTLRLEKVGNNHTVAIELPKGLYRVMQVEALLLDETIEQACVARLKETMESYLDSDGFKEWLQETFQEKQLTAG